MQVSAAAAVLLEVLYPGCSDAECTADVDQETVAFFHPNANGGGGGERVLWYGSVPAKIHNVNLDSGSLM